MSNFNVVSVRSGGVAKMYKNVIVKGMDLPVKVGTHKYWLAMAIDSFGVKEEFSLKELGLRAEKLGLKIKKEGAKTDAIYLASYYKKWLVSFKVMKEVV